MSLFRRAENVFRVASDLDLQPSEGYTVTAYAPGAVCSTGALTGATSTTAIVYPGHGIEVGDIVFRDLDPNTLAVCTASAPTSITLGGSHNIYHGDVIFNLEADSATSVLSYDGSSIAIYETPEPGTAVDEARLTINEGGEYGYWHDGEVGIWELVRDTTGTPIAMVLDAFEPTVENSVSYEVQYPHLLATSGSGTLSDPWPGAAIQEAWDALTKGAVGGGGVIRMLPGVYDLGSGAIGLDFTITGDYVSGITFEGYNHSNQGHAGNAAQNDDGVILLYSGTGTAIKLGHYATSNTYWMESSVFQGFKIRQNGTAGTGVGILARLVRFSRFKDINMSDLATGLALASVSDFNEIDNVTLNGNNAYGIDIGRTTDETGAALPTPNGQCNSNRIINSNIRNTARDNGATNWGVYIHSNSVGTVIKHNEFHDFDTANYGAIGVVEGSTDCTGTVVDSNYFEGNWVALFHNNPLGGGTNDMAGVIFTNNYVTQIEGYGVWVNSGSTDATYGIDIHGNVFQVPSASAPYASARGIQLGTYVLGAKVYGNVYRNQATLSHTLPNGNVNHGALGTITEDEITIGTMRVTGATTIAGDLVLPAGTVTGGITTTGSITSGGHLRGLLQTQAFTGNDTIAHSGRTVVDITNTSGANTLVVAAPSSVDGKILILRVKAITAGSFVIADSGNCSLSAAWDSAVGATVGSTLTLIASGVVWYEIARSKNT